MNDIKDEKGFNIFHPCNKIAVKLAAYHLWDIGCKLDKIQDQEELGDSYRILANDLYDVLFYDFDNNERGLGCKISQAE